MKLKRLFSLLLGLLLTDSLLVGDTPPSYGVSNPDRYMAQVCLGDGHIEVNSPCKDDCWIGGFPGGWSKLAWVSSVYNSSYLYPRSGDTCFRTRNAYAGYGWLSTNNDGHSWCVEPPGGWGWDTWYTDYAAWFDRGYYNYAQDSRGSIGLDSYVSDSTSSFAIEMSCTNFSWTDVFWFTGPNNYMAVGSACN